MEQVPYQVQEEDIDEVLSAYVPEGGGAWTEEARQNARDYVMLHVLDLDDTVKTAPEDERPITDALARARAAEEGQDIAVRREVALAAIEDLLIRDGFLDLTDREKRVFPAVTIRDNEHDDM